MNLVEFCENRYQELSLDGIENPGYNYLRDAEMKAIHQILSEYRSLVKLAMLPKCLYDYARVYLGYQDEPKPVMIDRAKKLKEEADKAKEEATVIEAVDRF